jgi:hypothetical protein
MKAGIGAQGQPSDAVESGQGAGEDSSGPQAAEGSGERHACSPAPTYAVDSPLSLDPATGPARMAS